MLRPEHDGLGDDLVVEDEVVRVPLERQSLQQVSAVGAQARVVLRQLLAQHQVLARA